MVALTSASPTFKSATPVIACTHACTREQSTFTITKPHRATEKSGQERADYYHRTQQYSITAVTTSTGTIAERYAYSAYGEPTICDSSGSPLATQVSSIGNRYSYTGREWDATVGLHHFRARWMSPKSGRFLGRDPIAYEGSPWSLSEMLGSSPLLLIDPQGTTCTAPPKPRTPKECCDAAKGDKNVHGGDIGGVICCDGQQISCVFVPGGSYGPKDPDAKNIIDRCTEEHEDEHKKDSDVCKGDIPSLYRDPAAPGVDPKRAECDAYTVENKCLEDGIKKCKTDECRKEVQKEIDHTVRRIKQYCKKK